MQPTRILTATLLAAALAGCQDTTSTPLTQTEVPAPQRHVESHTGWIFGRNGEPRQIIYEVRNNQAIIQGDITVGRADEIAATREALVGTHDGLQSRKGLIVNRGVSGRWPGGTVSYVIDPSFPEPTRLMDAMAHIHANNPGVRFLPRDPLTPDYIRFVSTPPAGGCDSWAGRVGGEQIIHISYPTGCPRVGHVIHEISHALGMHHEQQRCDRDQYIRVELEQVAQTALAQAQYAKLCDGNLDVGEYDEASIMHYSPYDFTRTVGIPTMYSLRGRDELMGQRNGQSPIDIQTVEFMYPRPVPVPLTASIDGPRSVARNSTATWSAVVTGGQPPYTYSWHTSFAGQYTVTTPSVTSKVPEISPLYLQVMDAAHTTINSSILVTVY